jgi:hypothetical protein
MNLFLTNNFIMCYPPHKKENCMVAPQELKRETGENPARTRRCE